MTLLIVGLSRWNKNWNVRNSYSYVATATKIRFHFQFARWPDAAFGGLIGWLFNWKCRFKSYKRGRWDSFFEIRCLGIEVYKCVRDFNPDYLNNLFKQSSTKYNMRDSCRLKHPKFNTFSYGQRSFLYYGVFAHICLHIGFSSGILCTVFLMKLYTSTRMYKYPSV